MNKKINNLQALRAFAALNVVCYHITTISDNYGYGLDYLKFIVGWGYSGVDIFFVLSGFIMVYMLRNGGVAPIPFIIERLTRVVPFYWLLTIIFFFFEYTFPSLFENIDHDLLTHTLFSLFFFSQAFLGRMPVLFDGWSLEYEVLFYTCIAIGLSFSKNALAFLIVTIIISFLIIFCSIDAIAFEFLLGVLLGSIYLHIKKNIKLQLFSLFLGLTLYLLTIKTFRLSNEIFSHKILMYGLPSLMIIYGLLDIKQIKEGILTKLGDASFSIYLLQVFTIPTFYKILKYIKIADVVSNDLLAIACLLITVVGGYIIYELIEIHLMRWSRNLFLHPKSSN